MRQSSTDDGGQLDELSPDTVALAETLSVAATVDVDLVRSMRLELFPTSSSALEADLWFSSLVLARGAGGMTLDVEWLPALRNRLLTRRWSDAAFEIVARCHLDADVVVRTEEAITACALRQRAGWGDDLEGLWRGVLNRMASDASVARNIARWAVMAQSRLPPPALDNFSSKLVMRLARMAVRATPPGHDTEHGDLAAHLAAEIFGETSVGVDLLADGIRLSWPASATSQIIKVPETSPLSLQVRTDTSETSRTVVLRQNVSRRVVLEPPFEGHRDTVHIDTLAGHRYSVTALAKHEFADAVEATAEPPWFKTAVFYEVLVRSFRDSNGDGIGDFTGLVEKLDYLQWLGIDCLVLPPIFTSPLRDGGYDVADHTGILAELGTVEDFSAFLDGAHQRGIRVVIDFVLNHTSEGHPWFQASRSDPKGQYGNFYVWSDTDELYEDARVILAGAQTSNWTWDPVRQQYYWHRFFSHQPDLNFDNPLVHDAVLQAIAFWLDMGLDGFRLGAVPYLYERRGTNGENLPETHAFLRKLRKFVDDSYPDRVLLAGTTQWPADVVDYLGDPESGDNECDMCLHSPMMSRLLLSISRQSRWAISQVMEQTPDIHEACQWGISLRDHNELSLEFVTEEERDELISEYARDPRTRTHTGIRRRLAPLLEADRRKIELLASLLLSLPGSPLLYYGDEIGMGDNPALADCDGLRTPMQWTPDRNAGFSVSTAMVPPVTGSLFGYERLNVEAQLEDTSSLLHWTRRLVHARRRHPAFSLGDFTDLGGSNSSVFSYTREHQTSDGTDVILCVNNLSTKVNACELDLRRFEGMVPVELLGGVPFPMIGNLPYALVLSPFETYWFRIVGPEDEFDRA